MSIFSRLFGEKKKTPAPPAKPVDFTEGMTYGQVRDLEDPVRRWALTKLFAEKGDDLAQYELGEAYLTGKTGVEESWELAEKYLLMAEPTIVAASTTLGMMYIRRSFVPEPEPHIEDELYDKGCSLLAKGVIRGYIPAVMCVSGDHDYKWNTRPNLRAILLEEMNSQLEEPVRALEQEDTPKSNYVLGMFHTYGIYYPRDFVKAREYLQRSADGGYREASLELGKAIYNFDDDEDDE